MKRSHMIAKDLAEMPDWMKKRSCPNKKKYLSGKRIFPKIKQDNPFVPAILKTIKLAYKLRIK